MYKYTFKFFLAISVFFVSCATTYQAKKVTYYDYRISQYRTTDSTISNFLKPYRDSLNLTMNNVIGESEEELIKKQPNGSMGMVFADALRTMAAIKYNTTVDAAFINNGGLRVPSLSAGKITIGKVYEIMPFDNLVIVQKVDGKTFQEFLNLIARKGGWPVSGITFNIVNGKAANILVNNIPFDNNKTYTIANSDYIANGGDDCDMLKNTVMENKNVLMREVFIEYFKMLTAKGEKVKAPNESRINIK